jgi:hypothetical protein
MQRKARENQKPNPPNKSDVASTSKQVQPPPPKKNTGKNKLTVYLVDVTSADHGDRVLRPGPKQNLEKKAKRNFQGMFPGRSPAR